ncbi:MAG: GGDEF domain-containing protein [Clostridia bacterium]|nr:GGDEF domain-containing protein [Clostridia bacterium]
MKSRNNIKYTGSRIAYTIMAVILLICVLLFMINYVYTVAENDGYENLHFRTGEFKDDIELQLISDRENLQTMANFASKLYADGEGYELLFDSFAAIGLIKDIGILTPGNVLVTKKGNIDVSDNISFAEEIKRGTYISGRVKDMTSPDRECVRSAVPIISRGNVVGILYGIINLNDIRARYADKAAEEEAQLYVLERGNGNFIIDTRHEELGNITALKSREFLKNFTYEQFYKDISGGKDGFSSFISKFTNENLYIHYAPLEVSDWQIMLARPERAVFAEAQTTRVNLYFMFMAVILIMSLYLVLIFITERKHTKVNLYASRTRKLLLGINQQSAGIRDALHNICTFAKARSAFFVDTDDEDYNYIVSGMKDKLLSGKDRAYFITTLMEYSFNHCKDRTMAVNVFGISLNAKLKLEAPELHDFMKEHGIKKVSFASIVDKSRHISILGSINAGNETGVKVLLEDVAVCFSIAIYNRKYLNKTENIAVTDSLTGLSNRMAYKKDIAHFDEKHSEMFSCIYIDVNELHVVNNTHGHSVGDGMLIFIANTIKDVFPQSRIYRMGGDEFLVFTENISREDVNASIELLDQRVEAMNYHISIGMDYRTKNIDTQTLVNEAEKRMYAAKAMYYQQKEKRNHFNAVEHKVDCITTGIREFDAVLSMMSRRYLGIYTVKLKTDSAHQILMPAYLKPFSENETRFSKIYARYVHELVNPDYQRALLSFLNYDVLIRQLLGGYTPTLSYTKIDGGKYRVTVYKISESNDDITETLWVFEKED